MDANIFDLKHFDTLPVLEVTLHDPAPAGSPPGTVGPVHDLTGSSSWKLRIKLESGSALVRDMVVFGVPTLGVLRYSWLATDWDAASAPDVDGSYTVGGLAVGPTLPLPPGQVEHRMEYEVRGPGGARLTFPNGPRPGALSSNDAYHILRVTADFGQA